MHRRILLTFLLPLMASCTPADEQYCNKLGVAGTAEFGNCLAYFHTQESAFKADRAVCNTQADFTYPQSLYDHGRTEQVFGGGYWAGHYHPMEEVVVEPDYRRNAEVDALRMRIIAPCMNVYGWNSPVTWEAGRHAVAATAPTSSPIPSSNPTRLPASLPWLINP